MHAAKIQTFGEYRQRLGKRAASYLLPFFSWLSLQHIAYVPRALRTVLFQLDYGLWFLMVLFLFTGLAYTAQLVHAKMGRECFFWLVFLGGCAAALLAYLAGVTFLSPSLLVIYLPYYTAAYFCGMHPELSFSLLCVRAQRILAYAGGLVFLFLAADLALEPADGRYEVLDDRILLTKEANGRSVGEEGLALALESAAAV